MAIKQFVSKLFKITDNETQLEMSCVRSFLAANGLIINDSTFWTNYFADLNEDIATAVDQILNNEFQSNEGLLELVEIFEQLVPPTQRKTNGVVYTPEKIKHFIIKRTIIQATPPLICDPACGCGSFLISAAEYMHQKYKLTYTDIISKYLYGVDIDRKAIQKAKVLLSILALMGGEEYSGDFNLLCADMLSVKTTSILKRRCPHGFDCVIGNPPYVRYRNMDEASKINLREWDTAKGGNVDLYMPFFEVGVKLLHSNGILGYISPNNYLQGVNGRLLRSFFQTIAYDLKIFDFRDTQIFKGVTSYTCVTVINSSSKSSKLRYTRKMENLDLAESQLSVYYYSDFADGRPWRLCENKTDSILRTLESRGKPLSSWRIRNGLATLKNDLFFFVPHRQDNRFYYRTYNGITYKIEKAICIDIVKPNIIKCENDLKKNQEKAIFPYTIINGEAKIISEDFFSLMYPMAYAFLNSYRHLLQARDKGAGNYPAWYAYGRTQGLNNFGRKLLIPYISDKPIAVLNESKTDLFYCGYALFAESTDELRLLKVFLESSAFWFYIKNTSKPYAKGYMAFAKNYISKFSIPVVSSSETEYALSEKDRGKLDEWVWSKFGLVDPEKKNQ